MDGTLYETRSGLVLTIGKPSIEDYLFYWNKEDCLYDDIVEILTSLTQGVKGEDIVCEATYRTSDSDEIEDTLARMRKPRIIVEIEDDTILYHPKEWGPLARGVLY